MIGRSKSQTDSSLHRGRNNRSLRVVNRTLVLELLLRHGPLSRTDLAKITGLGLPTLSRIVRSLMDLDLVEEGEKGDSSGGRKPVLIHIKPRTHAVIGIDIGGPNPRTLMMDLTGEIISRKTYEFDWASGRHLLDLLIEATEHFHQLANQEKIKILGVGVAAPGLVDASRGHIIDASHINVVELSLRDELARHFDYPVFIENDASLAALGEFRYIPPEETVRNLVYVKLSSGIGAGLVVNGAILWGEHGASGEIGHVIVDPQGEQCICGQIGCLETVASERVIRERLEAMTDPALQSFYQDGHWSSEIDALLASAKAGFHDPVVLLQRVVDAIAVAVTNLSNLLDIGRIVIDGPTDIETLVRFLKRSLKDRYMYSDWLSILPSRWPEQEAACIGACHYVLGSLASLDGDSYYGGGYPSFLGLD